MVEPELIDGCKRGENKARKELYERYAEKMLCLCYRYIGHTEEAHDLLHDGFLKVFASIVSFTYRGEGSLRAWMSRVFVNLALERLRKKDLLRDVIPLDAVSEQASEPEPDADGLPIELLMHFIAELPPGYRTVFNLYVFEEWSHREIASRLGINEKSSASQFYRARCLLVAQIREAIDKQR